MWTWMWTTTNAAPQTNGKNGSNVRYVRGNAIYAGKREAPVVLARRRRWWRWDACCPAAWIAEEAVVTGA